MGDEQIQKVYFKNGGHYTCWPTVSGGNRHWDGKDTPGRKWTLDEGAEEEVDLIEHAGFTEGTAVTIGINVLAGTDKICNTNFIVKRNNRRATMALAGWLHSAFRESKIAEEAEGEVEGEEDIPVAEAEKSDTESAQHSDVISNIPHLSSLPSLVPHTTSTKTTTVGAAEAIERGSSPPIHPAVQQMEDNDDMLFGDHPDYEYMTPEQQVKWKAEAPARLQKRLLEEEEEEDNGGEGPAKKTPRKK